MAKNYYLAKIGELSLKGGNKKIFEQRLIYNFKALLYPLAINVDVKVLAGRMYVECEDEICEYVEKVLSHLIGITSWAKTQCSKKNIEDISLIVMKEAKKAREEGAKTFKIEVRREDKSFPLNSNEVAIQVGGLIHTSGILKTDVHNPDVFITIEIRKEAYVYRLSNKGIQGLPTGSSGKGLLLLSGGIDSPVAGYKMLSRGMQVDFLYFHSHPFTPPEAQKKVEDLAHVLSQYEVPSYLNIVSFTDIQNKIKAKCPPSYLTLMMRICMMKIANIITEKIKAQCIITGESLSQVASQTVENLSVVNSCANYPVFRPLIGMNKEEIIKEARLIGTYDISIIPYDDCCTLFAPKHPILYGDKTNALQIYNNMEIEDTLKVAIDNRSVKKLHNN